MGDKTLSTRRRVYDRVLRVLLYLCGVLTCALLALIIGYIFYRGIPNITWELLSSQTSYIKDTIGILPNILNTVYLVVLAMGGHPDDALYHEALAAHAAGELYNIGDSFSPGRILEANRAAYQLACRI